jgi:hypothetical protein
MGQLDVLSGTGRPVLIIASAILAAALISGAAAQDRDGRAGTEKVQGASANSEPKKTEKRGPRSHHALSAEDERAALEFAQVHHPELHALLLRLRGGRKGQYLTAVRQLDQTRERLERLRERTPERYEPSLEQWRIDSRLRLLVARMTMSDDPALTEELHELLAERTRLRLELLKQDRERLRSRLEKIESQIETLESDPAAVAEKDLAAIRRSLGIPTSTNRPSTPTPPKTPRKKKPASAGP